MSRWRGDFRHSAVWRISLLNALLLLLGLGTSFAGAWIATERCVEMLVRDRIDIEVDALLVELAQEGQTGLSSAIATRFHRPGSLHYMLIVDGSPVIGDLVHAPLRPGWHRLDLRQSLTTDGDERKVMVRVARASDGTIIAVGEDLGPSKMVREMLFGAMVPGGVVVLLVSAALSATITRVTLKRINEIIAAVRAVEDGDLTARVRTSRRGTDDLDALAIAVNAMLDRIDDLVATIARVSTEIAHDLRTPLTHVKHALDTARWSSVEPERAASIEAAREGTTHALRLFDAMLKLAEIDSGRARDNFQHIDIIAIAERAVDAYHAEIESTGRMIEWSRQIDRHCARYCNVMGDADLLTQALANLLDNALKHSQPGGAIRVRISNDLEKICVAVEDDGPSIDPTDIEVMLRPFGRLDTARNTPGSGLGLAISSSVARLHGGRIRIDNLEPGLCVALEVPCKYQLA